MISGFTMAASTLEALTLPGYEGRLKIKRDDLIHPIVSGNKWRKLKYLVQRAEREGKSRLVTFGGAYSNHMVATACAGAVCKLKTACFIRADEPLNNHYLAASRLYGMELIPVNREAYRQKHELYQAHFGKTDDTLFIDEGGASTEAQAGVADIMGEPGMDADWVLHASATATTAIGLGKGIVAGGLATRVHAVAVLNNAGEQREKIREAGLEDIVTVHEEFTLGGYAKTSDALMDFIRHTVAGTGIMLDPVYTGKALIALQQLNLPGNGIFLHTGGTLGIFSDVYLKKLFS